MRAGSTTASTPSISFCAVTGRAHRPASSIWRPPAAAGGAGASGCATSRLPTASAVLPASRSAVCTQSTISSAIWASTEPGSPRPPSGAAPGAADGPRRHPPARGGGGNGPCQADRQGPGQLDFSRGDMGGVGKHLDPGGRRSAKADAVLGVDVVRGGDPVAASVLNDTKQHSATAGGPGGHPSPEVAAGPPAAATGE